MMRGPRRQARDIVLQILYQLDVDPSLSPAAAVDLYFRELLDPGDADDRPGLTPRPEAFDRAWIEERVAGVVRERDRLDARLAEVSRSWRVERMSRLDRNILRLALYELSLGDPPRNVVFNEAVELAKRFGSAEAPAFINGVLDSAAAGSS